VRQVVLGKGGWVVGDGRGRSEDVGDGRDGRGRPGTAGGCRGLPGRA